jgi:hypothetical protein
VGVKDLQLGVEMLVHLCKIWEEKTLN